MADPYQIELLASSSVVADGVSSPVDIGELRSLLRGSISVSALAGAPPLLVSIETSPDGATGWKEAVAFEFRGARVEDFTVDELRRYCRLKWTVGGTTATFSSSAEAHVLYATRRDLKKKSLPDAVFEGEERDVIAEELLSASADGEDALRIQYPSALQSWPDSLRMRLANIARYRILSRIGFQPSGVDELVVKDHDDAQLWLRAVAARRIVLSGVSSPAKVEAARVSFSPDNPDPPPRFSDDWGDFG